MCNTLNKEQEKFFKVFVAETQDILSEVSDDLLELEKNTSSKSIINALFRHLHTLKGNASLDGFEKITNVAHIMENIFDKARDEKLIINSNMVDILFEALDILEMLLDGLLSGEYQNIEVSEIIDSLNEILASNQLSKVIAPEKSIVGGVRLSSAKKQELSNLLKGDIKSYLLDLTFTNEVSGALNTFIIINNLKTLSNAIISSPPEKELQKIKQLAKSQILVLTCKSKPELENAVKSNCETSVIIEIGLDKIPSEEMELDKKSINKFVLEQEQAKILSEYIETQKAYYIQLNYAQTDGMRNINSYIILNTLNSSSKLLLSNPDAESLQKGEIFKKVMIIYCGDLEKQQIDEKVMLNCKDYIINQINSKNINKYTNIEEISTTQKEKERKQLSKQISIEEQNKMKKQTEAVSVEVEKFIVDGVIENIGELVVNMNFISSLMSDILEDEEADMDSVKENLKLLNAQVQGTALMLNTLMDYAFVLRLVPLKPLFKKLPRIVRDAARKVNKQVKLEISGQNIRVEQDVMHMLEGPIMHILRNCVDHGIEAPEQRAVKAKDETGVVRINAMQEHRFVVIEISDDGAGINTERVLKKAVEKKLVSETEANKMNREEVFKLLFHPGFSTKDNASEISGRGVGMDVVLHEMEKIGGTIELESEQDKGSMFRLKFPANV